MLVPMLVESCKVWTMHRAGIIVKQILKSFGPIVTGIQSIRMLPIITDFGGYLLEELNTMPSTSANYLWLDHRTHHPSLGRLYKNVPYSTRRVVVMPTKTRSNVGTHGDRQLFH